eukprot:TRINITY_DN19799_c0_g1_i2.p1 TRINITY_DN19799_c0_g1~~TRINITY_DN19799_c0_g1_i2.p1  ORF type:complete len:1187 (-),score=193.45 TRINITY_DN19799_c0_g1_i2:273-3833(-)
MLRLREQGATEQLDLLVSEIASPEVLNFSDPSVRALSAACVIDMFRIFAPEPPFSDSQTVEVFKHMIRELGNLSDDKSHLFETRFYVLEQLCAVKAVFVLLDMEEVDLIGDLFLALLSTIKIGHSPAVEGCMVSLMQETLEESDRLTGGMVRIILQPLCRSVSFPSQGTAAKQLVKKLLQALPQQIHNELANWVQMLVQFKEWPTEMDSPECDQEPMDAAQVHCLVLELASASASLIGKVLPVLEAKMQAGDTQTRIETAHMLGDLLLSPSAETLMSVNPGILDILTHRGNDVAHEVRLMVVNFVDKYLGQHPPQDSLCVLLADRLMDPEDSVRAAAVSALTNVARAHPSLLEPDTFIKIGERTADKKLAVRCVAVESLCSLYAAYRDMGRQAQKQLRTRYDWMASKVLGSYNLGGSPNEVYNFRLLIEQAVERTLLPQQQAGRAEAMADLYSQLEPTARVFYKALLQQRMKFGQGLLDFVTSRQSGNKARATAALSSLGLLIPDTIATKPQLLNYLGDIKDKRALRLLKTMCEPCNSIEEAFSNKTKVVQQSAAAQSSEVVQSFLGRSAATALTIDDIQELFALSQTHADAAAVENLLVAVSEVAPSVCAVLLPDLAQELHEESQVELVLTLAANCGEYTMQEKLFQTSKVGDQLISWCSTENGKGRVASLAARVICEGRNDCVSLLTEFVAQFSTCSDLEAAGDAQSSILAALKEVARVHVDVLRPFWSEVLTFLVKCVLNGKPVRGCVSVALELITQFICSVSADVVQALASEAIEHLRPLLHRGSKILCYPTVKAILQMSQRPQVAELVGPELFHLLASSFEKQAVGSLLIEKKELYFLLSRGLHPLFSVLFTLCSSFDEDTQASAKRQLTNVCSKLSTSLQKRQPMMEDGCVVGTVTDSHPEAQLPYLVHYLAHRTGFPKNKNDPAWEEFLTPLQMYLSAVLSNRSGNISYIHAVLKAILRTRDGMDSPNDRIHHISYVAMGLLQKQRGQTFPVYSQKIQLPCSYFDPTASVSKGQQFEIPGGIGVLPRSPAAKKLTPSKSSPASKRRAEDARGETAFGIPSNSKKLKPSPAKKQAMPASKRRLSTSCATEERKTPKEHLHELSHPSSSEEEHSAKRRSGRRLSTRTDVNVVPAKRVVSKQKGLSKEIKGNSGSSKKMTPKHNSKSKSAAVSPFDFVDDEL